MADVVACTHCGGMIEPMKDEGIIPMLVTHASFRGPIFHLAYFCCEKCLKAFVNENANGALSSIPCVVLPEEADMSILEDLPKLVLAPVMKPPETEDIDKLFEEMADEMYEGDDCEDEYDLYEGIDGDPNRNPLDDPPYYHDNMDEFDEDAEWWEDDDEEED